MPIACRFARRWIAADAIPVETLVVAIGAAAIATPGIAMVVDGDGLAVRRFDARAGTAYLIRPDQHVAARWRAFDAAAVRAAVARATCNDPRGATPCRT